MKKFLASQLLFLAFISPVGLAGENYKLEYDRFENSKSASYDLRINDECKLTKKIGNMLHRCTMLASSNFSGSPSIILYTVSDGYELKEFTEGEPYSNNMARAIITYKSGIKINTYLQALYWGRELPKPWVLESVIIRLGGREPSNIDKIELKYGTNEYYIKLDPVLTKKALNYEE